MRHHGDLARLELAPDELALAVQRREALVDGVRRAGYLHVTLDLLGYRQGSWHAQQTTPHA